MIERNIRFFSWNENIRCSSILYIEMMKMTSPISFKSFEVLMTTGKVCDLSEGRKSEWHDIFFSFIMIWMDFLNWCWIRRFLFCRVSSQSVKLVLSMATSFACFVLFWLEFPYYQEKEQFFLSRRDSKSLEINSIINESLLLLNGWSQTPIVASRFSWHLLSEEKLSVGLLPISFLSHSLYSQPCW